MPTEPTLHVPEDLAADLLEGGLARRFEPVPVEGGATVLLGLGDASAAALIILDVAGQVVTLTGVTPPLHAIAERIVRWRRRHGPTERKYALLAIGPHGQLRLDLDEKPDVNAVEKLLKSVYGDD